MCLKKKIKDLITIMNRITKVKCTLIVHTLGVTSKLNDNIYEWVGQSNTYLRQCTVHWSEQATKLLIITNERTKVTRIYDTQLYIGIGKQTDSSIL